MYTVPRVARVLKSSLWFGNFRVCICEARGVSEFSNFRNYWIWTVYMSENFKTAANADTSTIFQTWQTIRIPGSFSRSSEKNSPNNRNLFEDPQSLGRFMKYLKFLQFAGKQGFPEFPPSARECLKYQEYLEIFGYSDSSGYFPNGWGFRSFFYSLE